MQEGPHIFLTKSATALLSRLSGVLRARRPVTLTRRGLTGLAGGGLAVAVGEPLLDALSSGLRYGRWGAKLDDMLTAPEAVLPSPAEPEAPMPAVRNKSVPWGGR